MAIDVRRLKPTPTTLAALVGVLFAVSMGAARDFVWADLRHGMVRTDGLPRITRALIRLGFVLLLGMVAALLFNEVLRARSPLLAVVGGTPGRGELLPTALLPVTMFMIAVAWSFLLTGSIHSHWGVRLAVVVSYLGTTVAWLGTGLFSSGPLTTAAWAALGGVPVFFALRWRGEQRPALEFPVHLALVGAAYAIGHAQLLATYQASGFPLFLQTLESTILLLGFLVTPLLVLIGLDIADFAYRASTWTVGVISSRLGKVALGLALAGLLGWQLRSVVAEAAPVLAEGVLGHLGALAVPVLVGLLYWVVTRLDPDVEDDDRSGEAMMEAASRNSARLALGYYGWQMVLTVMMFVLLAAVALLGASAADGLQRSLGVLNTLIRGDDAYRIAFDVAVLAIGLVIARRGRHVMGLYLCLVGAIDGWLYLTAYGAPLGSLVWDGRAPTTFWWTLVLAAVTLFLLLRGRMTTERAEALLLLGVMTVLAGSAEGIEDPFSPFFAFAGVGVIAFGIIWDAITVGTWANGDSAAIPRSNRMLLYLGYVLFSVTVINWALTTHDLADVDFYTGGASSIGFAKFGIPLVYAIYALVLAKVLRRDPPPALPEPQPS